MIRKKILVEMRSIWLKAILSKRKISSYGPSRYVFVSVFLEDMRIRQYQRLLSTYKVNEPRH